MSIYKTASSTLKPIVDDNSYWDAFYKSNPPINYPSDFALSITRHLQKGQSIVDLGCGNGRDSRFFIQQGLHVLCADGSSAAIQMLENEFITRQCVQSLCCDFTDSTLIYQHTYDYFYSRFSLHAVTDSQQDTLFENVHASLMKGGLFFIEVRGVHDELYGKGKEVGRNAYIFDGHYRRFIVNEELLIDLADTGFDILYNEEKRGFAKFGNNDPIVIRVIARKQ